MSRDEMLEQIAVSAAMAAAAQTIEDYLRWSARGYRLRLALYGITPSEEDHIARMVTERQEGIQ